MRTSFMGAWRASASAALICAALTGGAAAESVLWMNAHFHTVNPERPTASWLLTDDEKIAALGGASDPIPKADRIVDLGGRTVLPGLIDAHVHLRNLGLSLRALNATGMETFGQVIEEARRHADNAPPGEWILGRGWDQNDWPERTFPHHAALSAATPDHPVSLRRVDGHALLVNANAMAIAGIDRDTPDPEGGKIIRDANGDPTGVLIDRAMGLVSEHVPKPTPEQEREAIELAIAECHKYGLTSVHEAGVRDSQVELYKQLIDEDAFDLRVYAMIRADETATRERYFEQGPLVGYGDKLTVRSVKAFADGALGSRGAALLEDYSDDPGNRGLMLMTPEQLRELSVEAIAAGFQVCTHAIGDRGNRLTLDAYHAAFGSAGGAAHRFRIEHAQIVALEDIPRFAALGVIPSMQATHATSDMYWAEDRMGPERIRGAYAWRKFLDAGCRIANGSDFPVEGVNPMLGFYAAMTRQDAEGWPAGGWRSDQAMTREETLRSFTIDAAHAAFEEGIKGSLAPGKFADFIVLDRDVMGVPSAEILSTRVTITVLGGKIVHDASGRH